MHRRALLTALPLLGLRPAIAQKARWPQRPLTVVVPFAPGGVADLVARNVGQAMANQLGQSVVIDNRPGAGGIVATQTVLQAPADGHTLLLISNATAVSVHLVRKLPYDVSKDLAPITTLGFFDLGIAVAAESRFRTLQELIAYGRANPGKLTVGTISVGSSQHLAAELFKARTGLDLVIVPYRGTPAVLGALRSGEVDVVFEILSPLLPQLAGRTLRALAVTGTQRFSALPEVPTVIEQGVAGYQVSSWNALAARAGTPAPLIEQLRQSASRALAQPALREQLRGLGVTARTGTPAELAALLASEIKRWGEVVRAAKIEPD